MEQIGSAENAAYIKAWARSQPDGHLYRSTAENPPEGWAFLGEGVARYVFRGPDGVAYKVQKRDYQDQSNEWEYETVQRVLKCDPLDKVRIPKCQYFPDSEVLAMECVKGKTVQDAFAWSVPEYLSSYYRIADHFGLSDMHNENVMYDEETDELVPVDFAF